MKVALAPDPPALFRIGRAPNPLAFPPLSIGGHGRYDDPLGRLPVLYAALERRGAFMETLDQFRFDLAALAARDQAMPADVPGFDRTEGVVPARYFTRRICRFRFAPGQRWLDARSPQTHAYLRRELSARLTTMGLAHRFVLGDLLTSDHRVTQLISQWAIDNAYDGIAYASCHDPSLTCWAIFGGSQVRQIDEPKPISRSDPDLRAVAEFWKLEIA